MQTTTKRIAGIVAIGATAVAVARWRIRSQAGEESDGVSPLAGTGVEVDRR